MRSLPILVITPLIALLGACASTPGDSSQIESLKQEVETIESLEATENEKQYAPIAVQEARESVNKLNKMSKDDADKEDYEHQLYLAKKKIEIAKEMVAMEKAEEIIDNSDLRRKDLQISAGKEQLKEERKQVQNLKDRAAKMTGRAEELQQQVDNLKAEETERGLVLTLDSVLFETGSSTVQAGSVRTLEQVSEFLNEYPEREILIEGFTDSSGDESYNQQLSQQRAQEVKRVLTSNGVEGSRMTTEGHGESFPVANNSTAAGRQQNRRVEIIVAKSNDSDVANRTSMSE